MKQSTKTALMKTISYAVMHMTIALSVAFILSGSWKVALAIGMIEPCVQTAAFFFHEKFWHKIDRKGSQHHDAVIDSTSPISSFIEKILKHKH